jgi:tRNA(fMet)-specific endonuclease VapC
MPSFILDTDTLTLWQRGHLKVTAQVANHQADIATTIITVEEQVLGRISGLRKAKGIDQVARAYLSFTETVHWLRKLDVLTYSEPAVIRYGLLRKQNLGVRGYDLRIAAIALEAGATVVTKNHVDFSRIPGLTIADWSV